jgi:uncharacterized repeat protein (TIGR01451 family)
MFAGLSATADLVVDTFTKDQIMNGPSTQNTVFDFTGTILGRERDAADETEFGQAEVIGGELVITGAPNAVVFLVLQWDGFDADNALLNPVPGISPTPDLTEAGESHTFEFGFNQLVLGADPIAITIVAFSGATDISTATRVLSDDIPVAATIAMPFSTFTTIAGSGVDFTAVTAIEITIQVQEESPLVGSGVRAKGPTDNLNFALDFIQTARGVLADVSATKVDEVINEIIVDGVANPGESIRYTIVVSNAGPDDVSAMVLEDLLPPGTTLVPGSIQTSPIARDDSYATPSVTSLSIPAPGVLLNDNDPDGDALVIDSFDTISALGDPVTLNPDGSFLYLPTSTGGTDTFAYAISDGVFTNDALVTIVIDAVSELAVTLNDDVDPVTVGDQITFTSVVVNNGPSDSQNVQITHTFPVGVNFLSAAPGPGITCNNPSPGLVVCDISTLAIGATATINLLTEAVGSGFVTSLVTVTTTTLENDLLDNLAEEVTFINSPPVAPDITGILVLGNTLRSVAAPGVLAGAFDPEGQPIFLLTTNTNSVNGGTVTIMPDGSFEYLPAAGFAGPTDTFNFIISDGLGTDTGSVELNISNMIWYVDNSLATNGDGTSVNPLNTLVDVNGGADVDSAGDIIFLFSGSGSYTGGLVLEADQSLIGQGVDLILGGTTLVAAASRPLLVDGLALAQDNTVRGLDIGSNAAGNMLFGLGISSLSMDNAKISGNGGIQLDGGALSVTLDHLMSSNAPSHGVQLDNLSGDLTVTGLTRVIAPGASGIALNTSPGFTGSFGDTLVNNAGSAVLAAGVSLGNSAGALSTFNTLNITTVQGAGFVASGAGTVNIANQPATIDATGGAGIDINGTQGQTGGTPGWTFDTVMSTTSAGRGIVLANLTDDFSVSGEVVVTTPVGTGIDISGSPGVDLNFSGVTITGGGADGLVAGSSAGANLTIATLVVDVAGGGVDIDGINDLTIQANVANTLQTADGILLDLSNITNADINFGDVLGNNNAGPGVIMDTVVGDTVFGFLEIFSIGGDGMNLQNAGNVNITDAFSFINASGGAALVLNNVNAAMDLGTVIAENGLNGIFLTQVTGAINIFDDTVITATVGAGIDISNSGTGSFTFGNLEVNTAANNQPGVRVDDGGSIGNNLVGVSTVDSGSAAAVDIATTALSLVFAEIRSTGGVDPGIRLDTVSGQFTVKGDNVNTAQGGNASGGQITGKLGDAVVLNGVESITLQRMQIDNAGGRAISISNATSTVLAYCRFDNSTSHGISGSGNQDLTITDCVLDGNGTIAGDSSIRLVGSDPGAGLTGNFSMTGSLIVNYPEHALLVENYSGNLDATIDGCTIDDNNDLFGADAILFVSANTARIRLDLLNSSFDASEGAIVRFESDGTTGNDLNILNNISTNGGGPDRAPAGGGIDLLVSDVGGLTFDMQGNSLTGLSDFGIRIQGNGNVEGRIGDQALADGNTILTQNTAGAGNAIELLKGGSVVTPAVNNATWTILVQNNTLGDDGTSGGGNTDGISVIHRYDNGRLNLTMDDNTIQNITNQGIDILSEDDGPALGPRNDIRIVNNAFVNLSDDAIEITADDSADICVHIQGNDDNAGGSPGIFDLSLIVASAVLQITQSDTAGLAAANNFATVTASGLITFNGGCFNPTLPTNP